MHERKYQLAWEENLYEGEDDQKLGILMEILLWSDSHKEFDPLYIENVYKKLEEFGKISGKEYNKCVGIYYSFRMDK